RIDLAEFCVLHKRLPLAGLRLWTGLFADGFPQAEDSKVGQMYNAACAAALAAGGDGLDVAQLGEDELARGRRPAVDWPRAAPPAWTRRMEKGTSADWMAIEKRMESWQNDPDLGSLRDEALLTKLPEAEQELCRKLWTDVAALRDRARTGRID